ncbi:hypothetical protein ANO11243_058730 [Dothideomycetidae sp. 11243]|nr:hypothetical protein ANO11243_058730 [fungal sp. No.11243]
MAVAGWTTTYNPCRGGVALDKEDRDRDMELSKLTNIGRGLFGTAPRPQLDDRISGTARPRLAAEGGVRGCMDAWLQERIGATGTYQIGTAECHSGSRLGF